MKWNLTNSEAIQAIKDNYPPSNYTILRESLDMSIKALEENDKLKAEIEQLKEELKQSVKLPCNVGDAAYVLAECQAISPRLDGTLYDSHGGFGTATGYYCPYEDNCPHINSGCDCEQLKDKTAIFEDEINGFVIENNGNILVSTEYCGLCGNMNEYIFLTREEAEQALKGGE